jgi:Zn-finger nucleic acid-binding protein
MVLKLKKEANFFMKDCPVCQRPLQEIPRYGVLIDICSFCRGVWLDHGELDKVISLARDFQAEYPQTQGQPPVENYEKDYYKKDYGHNEHHGYPHKKKKKHTLSDVLGGLFD